jgi:hypothetical protein
MSVKNVATSTKTKYVQAVGRIEYAGLNLNDTDAVMKHLESLGIGISAMKTYLSGIRHVLLERGHEVPKVYVDKIHELMGQQIEKERKQELTDKQVEQYVPYKTLLKTYKELPMGVEKVLAGLYTLTPPLRNNFGDMRVVNHVGSRVKGNLLAITQKKAVFVMRDYKTSGVYGDVRIPLEQKAFALIRDWFKHLGGQPEFLLGKEMSQTVVANTIESAFKSTGKKVGINILRHAYIKEHLPALENSYTKRQALADKMLHSVDRQLKYYSQNVD